MIRFSDVVGIWTGASACQLLLGPPPPLGFLNTIGATALGLLVVLLWRNRSVLSRSIVSRE